MSSTVRQGEGNMHVILMDSDSAVIEAKGSLSSGNERIMARLIFDIYISASLNKIFEPRWDLTARSLSLSFFLKDSIVKQLFITFGRQLLSRMLFFIEFALQFLYLQTFSYPFPFSFFYTSYTSFLSPAQKEIRGSRNFVAYSMQSLVGRK